ncbi:hypothetical protein Dacet_0645 [Denitrovibrio acetiphilus DSM 12809]|uniref:Uncharacterized protein n=1 Tax=Denitrovibrio acetiphilus (strain DSM 12809 / NBRC 114555 / N2460) TaxID=522772 RepID=D4H4N9_DENA2|nr:hypothetical protein [Denitrovibrio acetiphilus]ADD67433.1 hypothetical protein Dacet_0645 [Denitrovibrio acetiphilus DSM 12809]
MKNCFNIRDYVIDLYKGKYSTSEASVIGNGIERFQSDVLNNQTLSYEQVNALAEMADKYYTQIREKLISEKAPINEKRQLIADYLTENAPLIINPKESFNIIKDTCKELKMNYEDLGSAIGYSQAAIRKSASLNAPSAPMVKAINLYKENLELKNKIARFSSLQNLLSEFITDHTK